MYLLTSLRWSSGGYRDGKGLEEHYTQPADVLVANWLLGKPATLDFAVTSPLISNNFLQGCDKTAHCHHEIVLEYFSFLSIKDQLPQCVYSFCLLIQIIHSSLLLPFNVKIINSASQQQIKTGFAMFCSNYL